MSRLDAYVDGELPLEFLLDADCHLARCESCTARVRFEKAFHSWIRIAAKCEKAPLMALQRRIRRALIAELKFNEPSCVNRNIAIDLVGNETKCNRMMARERLRTRPVTARPNIMAWPAHWRLPDWRVTSSIAIIAAVAVCWGARKAPEAWAPASISSDLSMSQLDRFLDLMTERHSEKRPRPVPYQPIRVSVETTLVPPFSLPPMQDVRTFPARRRTDGPKVRSDSPTVLIGESAPYVINGHRVTFFTYRAQTAPLRALLDGQLIDGHVVYIGTHRGYSIASIEAGPIGFAITSDLPPVQNGRVILSAVTSIERH